LNSILHSGAGRVLLALLAGALSVIGFAPFELWPLPLLSLAVLLVLVDGVRSRRQAGLLGFAWGWGAFLAGVSWLYVALNRFGGMAPPLAGLAVALCCAYLALYPALVSVLWLRLRTQPVLLAAAGFGALWLLGEWLRGVVFTGFPWLALGYSQTPPSPLAGYLPLLGVYGVGGLAAFAAALLGLMLRRRGYWGGCWRGCWRGSLLALGLVAGLGFALSAGLRVLPWTAPVGEPLRIALVQTNVPQHLKWEVEHFSRLLEDNLRVVEQRFAAPQPPAVLVLPETAFPTLIEYLPADYLQRLQAAAQAAGGDLIIGAFQRDEAGHIYNAALSLGQASSQHYAKQHLVPFGEYSPPLFGWFYRLANIPMSDQTPGPVDQQPFALGGQQIALNICYEDVFGAELIRSLPQAGMMLNLSNLAWYGESWAQPQHLQIARVRALESGRPMLRATNTGMTALVMPDGAVRAQLDEFVAGVLEVEVRAYQGMTPYARAGDWPLVVGALLVLGLLWRRARMQSRIQ
jgi:apolipoprotein N-acyltransferase